MLFYEKFHKNNFGLNNIMTYLIKKIHINKGTIAEFNPVIIPVRTRAITAIQKFFIKNRRRNAIPAKSIITNENLFPKKGIIML